MFLKKQKRTLAFLLALVLMLTTFMSVAVFPASAAVSEGDCFGVRERGADVADEIGYTTLQDAIDHANEGDIITLLKDITISGNYEIPSGVTLLIPFDADHTLHDYNAIMNEGAISTFLVKEYEQPKAYKTLTMAANSTLTVAEGGAICVGGQVCSTGSFGGSDEETPIEDIRQQGVPSGYDGRIHMLEGSKINVENGAYLYSWGYIWGIDDNIMVEAKSGAVVAECFQARGFRGMQATFNAFLPAWQGEEGGTFPFNQYYVQNIEVPLKLNSGASETLLGAVVGVPAPINFIGDNGMFQIEDGGYLIKDYDEATDRLMIETHGNATLGSLSVELVGMGKAISTDMVDYLPLSNNITIDIVDGTIDVAENIALLPGSELKVGKDATVIVTEEKNVFVMDSEDWVDSYDRGNGDHTRIVEVAYTAANNGAPSVNRAEQELADADVDINGTAEIYGGFLTREDGGGNIHSSENSGTINYCCMAAVDTEIYFVDPSNSQNDAGTVPKSYVEAYIKNPDPEKEYLNLGDWSENGEGGLGQYTFGETSISKTVLYEVHWYRSIYDAEPIVGYYAAGEVPAYSGEVPYRDDNSECIGWTNPNDPEETVIPYGQAFPAVVAPQNESDPIEYFAVYKNIDDTLFKKHSLSLDGTIKVNFYVDLSGYDDPSKVTMDFEWGNAYISTNTYSERPYKKTGTGTKKEINGVTLYEFTVPVAAKELNDTIKATVKCDGMEDVTEEYSGTSYAYKLLAKPDDDAELNAYAASYGKTVKQLKAVVVSMLNYCAAAQNEFEYHQNNLANSNLTVAQKSVPSVDLTNLNAPSTDCFVGTGVSYYAASVNLGSDTAYTVYLLKEGSDPAISYSVDGGDTYEDFTADNSLSNAYAVRCTVGNIPAAKTLDNIILKVNGTDCPVNMKTYIGNVLTNTNNTVLVNLAKALYDYGTKAKAYFG